MLQEIDSSNFSREVICPDKTNTKLNLYKKLNANLKQALTYVICF